MDRKADLASNTDRLIRGAVGAGGKSREERPSWFCSPVQPASTCQLEGGVGEDIRRHRERLAHASLESAKVQARCSGGRCIMSIGLAD